MGACLGKEKTNEPAITDDTKNLIQVLLLGAGESGKSTVFKQFRINNLEGFSPEEKLKYKTLVYSNALKGIRTLIEATQTLNIPIEDAENKTRAKKIMKYDMLNVNEIWNSTVGDDIKALWADPAIKSAYGRRNEFQLNETADYYFDNISTINQQDYLPSTEDILRTRMKTTGIVEMNFTVDSHTVKLIDVGGQRNERKKWIHCFDKMSAVIYVISMSEFDLKCYEDDTVNRIDESLALFDETCNSRWFSETPIILFLNKVDLFKEKIAKKNLKDYLPDYEGENDFDSCAEFIKKKYLARLNNDKRVAFTHYTCATDTEQLKSIMSNIKEAFVKSNSMSSGKV